MAVSFVMEVVKGAAKGLAVTAFMWVGYRIVTGHWPGW